MAAGDEVFPYLMSVLAAIIIAWLILEIVTADGSSKYTLAVFLGAFVAAAMVTACLAGSRELSDLANMKRRLESQCAVVALAFDSDGRFILHFQSPHAATSWPNHWLPPGGLLEDEAAEGAAQERLRRLVDAEHEWGGAVHLASTNGSATYRRMNEREGQVPVQVEAFWVQWSEGQPWVQNDACRKFDRRSLRLTDLANMPYPTPPYYEELFVHLEALWRGGPSPTDLDCWTLPQTRSLEAEIKRWRSNGSNGHSR